MDIQSVEKIAKNIQTYLFKNSNAMAIGMHKSHFKGSGLTFKEHRVYEHGDDVRFIDWKLSAKTSKPFIKTFEEDRNVDIVIVLDLNLSMLVGYKDISKLQVSVEIACLLFLLAAISKDTVQIITIGEDVISLPKKNGKEGIVQFIAHLEKLKIMDKEGKINIFHRPVKKIDSKLKSASIMRYLSKKKEVVLLSDFHDFLPLEIIKKFVYRKNLHCFQISSPLDKEGKLPYFLYALNSNTLNYKKGNLTRETSSFIDDSSHLEQIVGKRFKRIDIEGRYLDQFVKEMI